MTSGDRLENAMEATEVPKDVKRAFKELAYTASEYGLIDIEFHSDGLEEDMIRLVALAHIYRAGVPEELRV